MYLNMLFHDNKTKLVYSNEPSQVHLSIPADGSSKRKAYKTCLKLSLQPKNRRLSKEDTVANIAETQQQRR